MTGLLWANEQTRAGLLNHFRKVPRVDGSELARKFTRIAGRCGYVFDPSPTRKYSPKRLGRCRFGRRSFDYRLITIPTAKGKPMQYGPFAGLCL
jgi:hypothetical protein